MLYQTRAVLRSEWEADPWRFRKRVCELLGVRFDPEERPKARVYLHLLAVIKRTTKNGSLRGILDEFLANA